MLILAIESSAKPVSVAVIETSDNPEIPINKADRLFLPQGKLLGQYFQNNGFSHSRTLLVLAESLLKNLDIATADIDLIAVASGPGSFTGVRIGVSAAKGIAWGLDIPVCGVSTLEAMAYQTTGTGVIICPVMDARREQVYNALFEWRDGILERLSDDRAISIQELAMDLQGYNSPPLLVGDGVDVCTAYASRSYVSEPGISNESKYISFLNYHTTPELLRYQTAYGVALAALSKKPIPATDLEPSYLRPSQAERERSKQ